MPGHELPDSTRVSFASPEDAPLFERAIAGILDAHLALYDNADSRKAYVFLNPQSLSPALRESVGSFTFRTLIRVAVAKAVHEADPESGLHISEIHYVKPLTPENLRELAEADGVLRRAS